MQRVAHCLERSKRQPMHWPQGIVSMRSEKPSEALNTKPLFPVAGFTSLERHARMGW